MAGWTNTTTFLVKNAGNYSVDVNLNGCDTIGNIQIVF